MLHSRALSCAHSALMGKYCRTLGCRYEGFEGSGLLAPLETGLTAFYLCFQHDKLLCVLMLKSSVLPLLC